MLEVKLLSRRNLYCTTPTSVAKVEGAPLEIDKISTIHNSKLLRITPKGFFHSAWDNNSRARDKVHWICGRNEYYQPSNNNCFMQLNMCLTTKFHYAIYSSIVSADWLGWTYGSCVKIFEFVRNTLGPISLTSDLKHRLCGSNENITCTSCS